MRRLLARPSTRRGSSSSTRYAMNFLYNQRRPLWRRQTCPRTSRPVMLRLGMMTRRRCQVVGLAVRRFNPSLRMLMAVKLIDVMVPPLAQAARCRHGPQRTSWRPSSAFTIVAPAATANTRNKAVLGITFLDPRDTGIIANRPATVVKQIRLFDLRNNYWPSLRHFCSPCFAMTHECRLVCVSASNAIHNAPGKRFRSLPMSPPATNMQCVARMSGAICGSVTSIWLWPRISFRSSTFGNTFQSSVPARAGNPVRRGRAPPAEVSAILGHPPARVTPSGFRRPIRSPILTIFWHCSSPHFSSRTGPERRPGNEPSMVLAEDLAVLRVWQC